MMYSNRDTHNMDEIINAPVGSSMRVLAEATAISMKDVGLGEYHITITARPANAVYGSNSSYIQIYYDKNKSIEEKNRWLFDVYDKVKNEIELYGSCQMEMLVTKKSSDTDLVERIGQSYQYACSINYAQNSILRIYMHEDTLNLLKKYKAKNLTLDSFFEGIDVRRE
jgi:DNA-binding Xre family transcriptional regulator